MHNLLGKLILVPQYGCAMRVTNINKYEKDLCEESRLFELVGPLHDNPSDRVVNVVVSEEFLQKAIVVDDNKIRPALDPKFAPVAKKVIETWKNNDVIVNLDTADELTVISKGSGSDGFYITTIDYKTGSNICMYPSNRWVAKQ